jgi:hypothetical protein
MAWPVPVHRSSVAGCRDAAERLRRGGSSYGPSPAVPPKTVLKIRNDLPGQWHLPLSLRTIPAATCRQEAVGDAHSPGRWFAGTRHVPDAPRPRRDHLAWWQAGLSVSAATTPTRASSLSGSSMSASSPASRRDQGAAVTESGPDRARVQVDGPLPEPGAGRSSLTRFRIRRRGGRTVVQLVRVQHVQLAGQADQPLPAVPERLHARGGDADAVGVGPAWPVAAGREARLDALQPAVRPAPPPPTCCGSPTTWRPARRGRRRRRTPGRPRWPPGCCSAWPTPRAGWPSRPSSAAPGWLPARSSTPPPRSPCSRR